MVEDKDLQNLDEYVELSAFADVEIGVAAANTINEAMEQVMNKIGEIFSPETHVLLLLDKKTDQLYVKFSQGKNGLTTKSRNWH